MPEPVDCAYFYGDYFRGRDHEECRLLEASPDNKRPWKRKLCDTCPVPEILRTTSCRNLALEAQVTRSFLRELVEITFAVCTEHMLELDDPHRCPACEAEDRKLWD